MKPKYRTLRKGELIKKHDEWKHSETGNWHPTLTPGEKVLFAQTYRRKVVAVEDAYWGGRVVMM